MSLDSLLDDIVNSSSVVATLDFTEATNGIPDYLLNWNLTRRQLIRDAEPYECKLFTAVDGTTIASHLADVVPTPLAKRNPRRPNVDKLLTAANTLNQICNLPNVKERIESFAHRHEEAQINIDYLESAFAKNETDLAALSKPQQAAQQPTTVVAEDRLLQQSEEEIRREQTEIARLEKRLREKDAMSDLLDDKLNDQLELQDQVADMDYVMDQMDDMSFGHAQGQTQAAQEESIATLERELATKRRQLQEYDTVLAALDKDPTSRDVTDSMPSAGTTTPRRGSNTSRPREVFQSLKARWDKVERGETGAEDDLFDEATMERLASSMHRVTRSLQALIEDFENVQEIDEHITLISQINNTFIDAIITQGDPNTPFPHPSPTNTPAHPDASFMSVSSMSSSLLPSAVPRARPAPQTVLAATVLQLVRNAGGELPFARLKTRIGDVARAQGLNEGQAVQAVYLLVANNLVVIDRSVKGVKEGVVRIV